MRGVVLGVDDDASVARVVAEVLRDEGLVVSWLAVPELVALQQEVDRLEPDAVLLDGGDAGGYGNFLGHRGVVACRATQLSPRAESRTSRRTRCITNSTTVLATGEQLRLSGASAWRVVASGFPEVGDETIALPRHRDDEAGPPPVVLESRP
jgi:CheY-like chemotaxis protein